MTSLLRMTIEDVSDAEPEGPTCMREFCDEPATRLLCLEVSPNAQHPQRPEWYLCAPDAELYLKIKRIGPNPPTITVHDVSGTTLLATHG